MQLTKVNFILGQNRHQVRLGLSGYYRRYRGILVLNRVIVDRGMNRIGRDLSGYICVILVHVGDDIDIYNVDPLTTTAVVTVLFLDNLIVSVISIPNKFGDV